MSSLHSHTKKISNGFLEVSRFHKCKITKSPSIQCLHETVVPADEDCMNPAVDIIGIYCYSTLNPVSPKFPFPTNTTGAGAGESHTMHVSPHDQPLLLCPTWRSILLSPRVTDVQRHPPLSTPKAHFSLSLVLVLLLLLLLRLLLLGLF